MPTAGEVMDQAAALQNDPAKTVYTFVKQIPYLNMAMRELEEIFEQNNVPITNDTSAIINIPANTSIVFRSPLGPPTFPVDLQEIQQMWERSEGVNPFIPMRRLEFLPHELEGAQISQLLFWTFNEDQIQFLAANADNDIKVDYVKSLFVPIVSSGDAINVPSCMSFLAYRTAAICSEFIGENKTRADSLNANAVMALDRTLGISAKGRQAITTRRRPFMQSYKRRSWW